MCHSHLQSWNLVQQETSVQQAARHLLLEDGDTFLRNPGLHMDYTAMYHRRFQHFLKIYHPAISFRNTFYVY
jgi:hypothetical protein